MTGFDDRKKAQERKLAQEGEINFKIEARRRKLLALWAAEMTGMNEQESLEYAIEVVKFGVENNSFEKVMKKIIDDASQRQAAIDEEQLKQKNAEFAVLAKKQVHELYQS